MRIPLKKWLTHFGACCIFLLLCALGAWQLYRLEWKQRLIQTIKDRASQPPLALEKFNFFEPLKNYDFQPVKIRGRYKTTPPLLLGPRTFKGHAGYHILQPFMDSDGRIILIDRGWIPTIKGQKFAPSPQGTITLVGTLRCSPTHTWFTPTNQPATNQWHSVKIDEMRQHLNLPLQPCYVALAEKDTPERFPVPTSILHSLPNRHLEYAVTWYVFALIFGVMYGLMISKGE